MTDMTLIQAQRKAESLVATLRHLDEDGADRFDAYLEVFWFDLASMLEVVDDLQAAVAEEVRWKRGSAL